MNAISVGWCATCDEVVKLVEDEQGRHRCDQCGSDFDEEFPLDIEHQSG